MCPSILAHASHNSRAWKTDYTACHPRKTTTYILQVVPITTHTHDRRKSTGKKETKERKEEKGNKRIDKEAKNEKGNFFTGK